MLTLPIKKKLTNREYMINLLLDGLENERDFKRISMDDGGASEEAMIYYNVKCPYFNGDERCHCNNKIKNRETCLACKSEWLNEEVDE